MKELEDWQKRVIEEKTELDEKLCDLDAMISDERFKTLPHQARNLLCDQSWVMGEYSRILQQRIALFNSGD